MNQLRVPRRVRVANAIGKFLIWTIVSFGIACWVYIFFRVAGGVG